MLTCLRCELVTALLHYQGLHDRLGYRFPQPVVLVKRAPWILDSHDNENNEESASIAEPLPYTVRVSVKKESEDNWDDLSVVTVNSPVVGSGRFFTMFCTLIS